jgi:hypothetical protein
MTRSILYRANFKKMWIIFLITVFAALVYLLPVIIYHLNKIYTIITDSKNTFRICFFLKLSLLHILFSIRDDFRQFVDYKMIFEESYIISLLGD